MNVSYFIHSHTLYTVGGAYNNNNLAIILTMYLYMYVYTFAAAEDKQKGPSFVLCIHSLYNNIILLEAHTHKIYVLMSMQVQ